MILSSIFKTATSFLGGFQTYLIVGAVSAVIAGSVGGYAGYRWELSSLDELKLADAQAQVKALNKLASLDKETMAVSLAAGIKEGEAQAKVKIVTTTITKEIPSHVTPIQVSRTCLSVGLMRVLRAASTGADPDSLALATGQSDDDCSDVSPVAVAGWFTDYTAASEGNAEQLNALEAWITADHAAQEANQ